MVAAINNLSLAGLGFVIFGIVLDKKKLASLAAGVSSALGTVVLLLAKLGATHGSAGSA